jgi:hypothetical protein
MTTEFAKTGIDWWSGGYHGCPDTAPQSSLPLSLRTPEWEAWIAVLRLAKQGDFSKTATLLDIYANASSTIVEAACATLVADAGDPAAFRRIEAELRPRQTGYEKTINFCDALQARGRLGDVPLMLECFERIATIKDADIIPSQLSRLLEPEPDLISEPSDFASLDDYREAVLALYRKVLDEIGSEERFVFLGKPYGVVPMAKALLGRLQKPHVQIFWRQRFEAPTGINCSAFYDAEKVLQPLAAAEIVEDFLESPKAAEFEDGVRYFFGHRIPD